MHSLSFDGVHTNFKNVYLCAKEMLQFFSELEDVKWFILPVFTVLCYLSDLDRVGSLMEVGSYFPNNQPHFTCRSLLTACQHCT